jgi:hypothetical protein
LGPRGQRTDGQYRASDGCAGNYSPLHRKALFSQISRIAPNDARHPCDGRSIDRRQGPKARLVPALRRADAQDLRAGPIYRWVGLAPQAACLPRFSGHQDWRASGVVTMGGGYRAASPSPITVPAARAAGLGLLIHLPHPVLRFLPAALEPVEHLGG